MNYVIVRPDELYHYGVKGMKWGVRKADYNTPGARSKNIFEQLDSLESQENRAYSENASKYRSVKKGIKKEEKAKLDSAKNANKLAKMDARRANRAATKYSLTHPISQHIKGSDSSQKAKQLRAEADKKAQESFEAKKRMSISKQEYTTNVREGKSAARAVFDKNNAVIKANFDKAYYDVIDAGKLATVKQSYKTLSYFSNNEEYTEKVSRLEDAEERRTRFATAYTNKHYKG